MLLIHLLTNKPIIMTYRTVFFLLGVIFIPFTCFGQNYPGGVHGAEVWYIADAEDIIQNHFENHASTDISLSQCDTGSHNGAENVGFLNFNPAVRSEKLCIEYRAALENSSDKSLFIVSEPKNTDDSYPLISTKLGVLNEYLPPLDALSENTYIIETNQGYASKMVSPFAQYQNAHVYYYSWNNYDIGKKFKSYGQKGETTFTIGRSYGIPEVFEEGERTFSGLFPEYVSYDRQLTKNERNRVESYLALKYGITKWSTDSYKSAQNIVFWDAVNNTLFPNNIFGIGRDDISSLNQLVCESTHKKDYLVAGTHGIISNNPKMQDLYSIENENFLVFGNNKKSGLLPPNYKHLERLKKVWLAQVEGDSIKGTPINVRLALNEDFGSYLEQIVEGYLFIWMLHDRQVSNNTESDFDNENVDYYKATAIMPGASGIKYADFLDKRIVFDNDNSGFDQFTFAIGPDCLVRFEAEYDCNKAEREPVSCYKLHIIVVGKCKEPKLVDADGKTVDIQFNQDQTDINGHDTYTAEVCAPNIYTALLEISPTEPPFEFEYEAEVIGPYIVDLGSEIQYLTSQQPTILLDAGQYLTDPATTFQWFFNGVLIHQNSTFLVEETGEYCVIVTTPDGRCQISRCVEVLSDLKAEIKCHPGFCDESGSSIEINILTGLPPYNIVIENATGQQTTYVPDGNPYWISGLSEGPHTILITDSLGSVYEDLCEFEAGMGNAPLSLEPDLFLDYENQEHILDVSNLWEGPSNYTYEWLHNGILMSAVGPHLTVDTPGVYTVKVYFPDTDCYRYAEQIVHSQLKGQILDSGCEEPDFELTIEIQYGFPPYHTTIEGISDPNYYDERTHNGDINISDIPTGDYKVTVTDQYQGQIAQVLRFRGVGSDLEDQLIAICAHEPCKYEANFCGTEMSFYGLHRENGTLVLDGSTLIDPSQLIIYEWSINGIELNHSGTELIFQYNLDNGDLNPLRNIDDYCEGQFITLALTDLETGCTSTETIIINLEWFLDLTPPLPRGYETTVYPNPSESNISFFYRINSITGDPFEGQVEVFNILGALIYSKSIEGHSEYIMPYNLVASGVYLIRTTTMDGTITVDRVIIK